MKKNFWSGFIVGILSTIFFSLLTIVMFIYITQGKLIGVNNSHMSILESAKLTSKVYTVFNIIDKNFLNDVDKDKEIEYMFDGIIASLDDKYAKYYTKDEYNEAKEKTAGIYCGIGITVERNKNTGIKKVIEVKENSTASEAGIKVGDILTKIDGTKVEDIPLEDVVKLIKGEVGTYVSCEVLRGNSYITLEVERSEIEEELVFYKMINDEIGYIKIKKFEQITIKQFEEALNNLESLGQKSMILDLRNNPGGLVIAATDIADKFLDKGIIVSTKDKFNNTIKEYKAKDDEKFEKPLIVLVNENSASAAEILSGALKDYNIGTILGVKTYGKGIVQSTIEMTDGTAVKLTTSKYLTPNGNNIHGVGIEPDIEVKLNNTGEDNQLEEAINLLENRKN